jgi:hypothetical protein
MAQVNVPTWDVGSWKTGYANAAVSANICLVADSSYDRGVKTPANGANNTLKSFKGVAKAGAAAGEYVSLARSAGDRVVCKANGTVTRGDKVFVTTADASKEGFVKKYTDFATDGAVLQIGEAETTAADGEFVEITLTGVYIKPS